MGNRLSGVTQVDINPERVGIIPSRKLKSWCSDTEGLEIDANNPNCRLKLAKPLTHRLRYDGGSKQSFRIFLHILTHPYASYPSLRSGTYAPSGTGRLWKHAAAPPPTRQPFHPSLPCLAHIHLNQPRPTKTKHLQILRSDRAHSTFHIPHPARTHLTHARIPHPPAPTPIHRLCRPRSKDRMRHDTLRMPNQPENQQLALPSWPNAVLMRAQMMRLYHPNHPPSHLQHSTLGTCSRTEEHRRHRHHDKFHGA